MLTGHAAFLTATMIISYYYIIIITNEGIHLDLDTWIFVGSDPDPSLFWCNNERQSPDSLLSLAKIINHV